MNSIRPGGPAPARQAAPVGAFDEALLALHAQADMALSNVFLDDAIGRLSLSLGFDAAWLGHASFDGAGLPLLLGEYRHKLPKGFAQEWRRIRDLDPLAAEFARQHDHAVAQFGEETPAALRRLLDRHGISAAASVTTSGLVRDGFLFLSLYRGGAGAAFTAGDVGQARLFLRHLAVALRNRLAANAWGAGPSTATLTLDGRLEHVSGAFLKRLADAGIDVPGGRLPARLTQMLVARGRYGDDQIRLRLRELFGLGLLEIDEAERPRPLTPRERQVAQAYARGLSFRDIARALGVSPHTARNHIRAVFGKLRVTSKLGLAATLALRPDQ
ncbi:helix-turn-helix transcriptional regulator [Chelatococcus reniformis]|uniref:Helix-turn-helix transcriptional regulator n=1 Tax=Chelatococcus reniformis TaxID=1494448 RepID=A0A916X751_9HYPH|nr:LuxR C-terminal-related transcriptional regulator [Chelatococcus reniformis]GGC49175.1 helix-turn-helix transcriptional regulator [Chelatococcus reniformis]